MKLEGERRDSFQGHETYLHCFQNFGNVVKPSLRRFLHFIATPPAAVVRSVTRFAAAKQSATAARLCPSAACSAATRFCPPSRAPPPRGSPRPPRLRPIAATPLRSGGASSASQASTAGREHEPASRAPPTRRGSDRASSAGRTRALPRGRRREAVATPSACRELKECKVRMARGGVNSLIKTSTRIT
jgi:hypothetical protein